MGCKTGEEAIIAGVQEEFFNAMSQMGMFTKQGARPRLVDFQQQYF